MGAVESGVQYTEFAYDLRDARMNTEFAATDEGTVRHAAPRHPPRIDGISVSVVCCRKLAACLVLTVDIIDCYCR